MILQIRLVENSMQISEILMMKTGDILKTTEETQVLTSFGKTSVFI